jgi:hypothetical protein
VPHPAHDGEGFGLYTGQNRSLSMRGFFVNAIGAVGRYKRVNGAKNGASVSNNVMMQTGREAHEQKDIP